MRISLALGPRRPLSPQTAWGCLTTNVAVPGLGSLVAGRIAGYPQAALALGGTALTLAFGLRFFVWFAANWSRLHDPGADSAATLLEMWLAVRWALLGIALFALGWLWALATSLALLTAAKKNQPPTAPPRLN
ncbi:MAG TPA: hypothetical protein VN829_24780 [Dongiaceae bacterium]|nr:hypothetical protein [Dongiaceae bacterium]